MTYFSALMESETNRLSNENAVIRDLLIANGVSPESDQTTRSSSLSSLPVDEEGVRASTDVAQERAEELSSASSESLWMDALRCDTMLDKPSQSCIRRCRELLLRDVKHYEYVTCQPQNSDSTNTDETLDLTKTWKNILG